MKTSENIIDEKFANIISSNHTIQELFEQVASRYPHREAIVYENMQLTYKELNEKSNKIAHYLRKEGVNKNTLVGIYIDRSLDWFTAILGILKAGGTYVPLNTDYPTSYLEMVLNDLNPMLIITNARKMNSTINRNKLINLFQNDKLEQQSVANPPLSNTYDDLAYVIYTSGSSGKPKGVMIRHKSVINLFNGLNEQLYEKQPPMNIALNAPFFFDASVQQIIQLLGGHTIHLLNSRMMVPTKLFDYLAQHSIEVIDCTPSQLEIWLQFGFLYRTLRPKKVLIGGEKISKDMWKKLSNDTRTHFYNVYGPTEATVDSTLCKIQDYKEPSIGKPLTNIVCYVLDENLRSVPEGKKGELYIGGVGVAKGYLNNTELTNKSFVKYKNSDGHFRLFKTGDQVSREPDGSYKYFRRYDHQVKIRGFRIELEEIEARIKSFHNVKSCVLVAQNEGHEGYLSAYLIVDDSMNEEFVKELKNYLHSNLPAYMVPKDYYEIKELPLTYNGKIDKKQLERHIIRNSKNKGVEFFE